MDRTYFASVKTEELPARISEKVDQYYNTLRTSGQLELWRAAYRHYYGQDDKGRHVSAKPARDGQQGELSKVKVAHHRNLSLHILNLTTQSKASWEARSLNTDYDSQSACILGQQVLDWYMREKGLGRIFRSAAEIATALAGEAYVVLDWDREKGESHITDKFGQSVKAGDLDVRYFHPVDIIREYYQDEDGKSDWHIVRRRVSKFRLAAQHPDHAEKILAMGDMPSAQIDDVHTGYEGGDEDRVTVYYFFHDKSPQLPSGRRCVVVEDVAIEDGPLPFKKYNVKRMSAGDQFKTPFGYASTYDIMALNDVIDMLYSAVISNNRSFALQNIWTKPGSGVKVTDLGSGLKLWESAEKPEAIQLTSSSPESYRLIEMLEGRSETISGVNSVARGNPEGALKGSSGSALALLQSMTIQFSSGLQESYAQLVEDVGDCAVAILQTHATIERVAAIVGKHNKSRARSFCGQDLDPINRIVVDMGNPAARTAAGRLQIADNLLQQGLIRRPEQYLEVLSTGRLEPMIESEQSQLLLIKAENEALKEGRPVSVLLTDDHALHIKEHLCILDDPETRSRPEIVLALLSQEGQPGHIQEHLNMWRTMPPDLAQMLGRMAPPPPPAASPHPGGEAGGGGPPPPPSVGPQPTDELPSLPTNPLTGEQVPEPLVGAAAA